MEYVLDHLRSAKEDKTLTSTTRDHAAELYTAITRYDNFLFFFYYKEITTILAHTSRMLQYEEIQISDVGRYITMVCEKLTTSYLESATHPIELLASGCADQIVRDLFKNDFNGTFSLYLMQLLM